MNVTVFGANGNVGQLVVERLLDDEHHVTAYVRAANRIAPGWGDRVRVVVGQLTDESTVAQAVAGADAVISTVGPPVSRKVDPAPLIQGTAMIVAAMERASVTRYVGIGTPSIHADGDKPTLGARLAVGMVKRVMPGVYQAVTGMAAKVAGSDLDWTIVRYLQPDDADAKGVQHVGLAGSGVKMKVTRADIADFIVAQLATDQWSRQMPQISN